jgi:hypothetical protein
VAATLTVEALRAVSALLVTPDRVKPSPGTADPLLLAPTSAEEDDRDHAALRV